MKIASQLKASRACRRPSWQMPIAPSRFQPRVKPSLHPNAKSPHSRFSYVFPKNGELPKCLVACWLLFEIQPKVAKGDPICLPSEPLGFGPDACLADRFLALVLGCKEMPSVVASELRPYCLHLLVLTVRLYDQTKPEGCYHHRTSFEEAQHDPGRFGLATLTTSGWCLEPAIYSLSLHRAVIRLPSVPCSFPNIDLKAKKGHIPSLLVELVAPYVDHVIVLRRQLEILDKGVRHRAHQSL